MSEGAGRSPRGCMLSSRADVQGDRHAARSILPDADRDMPGTAHYRLRVGAYHQRITTRDAGRSGDYLGTEDRLDCSPGGSADSPRSESASTGGAEAGDRSSAGARRTGAAL